MTYYSKKHSCYILLTIFLCLMKLQVVGQPNIKQQWQGEWITHPKQDTIKNSWLCFRKTVYLPQKIQKKVFANISVDSKYWLMINNQLVVFEGQLKRGPTPNDTYFDEVEISKYLRKGSNTIAVLVWFWGKDGFSHKNSGRAGLLFEAKAGNIQIKSDQSWKVSIHPAFGFTGNPMPNYRLPESNIHFDARKDIPLWFSTKFNDHDWEFARSLGKAPVAPWNALWKRPIPLWKDSGLVTYLNNNKWPKISTGELVRMVLPKNITITPYLKIEAPAGLTIDIRTDNYKGGSEYNVRTEYVTKEGVQEFETFGYMNGHEVIYQMPAGVKIISLKYRETRYNTEHIGYFKSSDSRLNSLWIKSLNTMNVNMRDAIQDPDRERAQWWGDAVIMLGEIFYSADSNGYAAIRKAISNLVEWQKSDKVLYSPVPSGNWDKELPTQMLAAIGKYGFYRYFEYTNDTAFVKYSYPAVKRYLELWKTDTTGLVIHRKGGWDWQDWGSKIDAPLLDNAWYYMALDGAKKMAAISGFPEEASAYDLQMKKLFTAFNREFWNGSAYSSKAYTFSADDRGNGLAVVAGLVNQAQWEKIRTVLDTTFHAGPYLEKYIMEAYFIMGDATEGIKRMEKRYDPMIKSPISTLWEGWAVGSGTYGGGSYNHGWSGGPLTLMSQYIGGLSPGKPGYQDIRVFPQPGDLKWVELGSDTKAGFVKIKFSNNNSEFNLKIEAKKGGGMIVGIPVFNKPYKLITANGKRVLLNDKPISRIGIEYKGKVNNFYVFEVPAANWKFRALFE